LCPSCHGMDLNLPWTNTIRCSKCGGSGKVQALGTAVVHCPPMLTVRTGKDTRTTTELPAPTDVVAPDGTVLAGLVTFPPVTIDKVFGPLWKVRSVEAKGTIGPYQASITLEPEWTVFMLALPCKASGTIGPWKFIGRFPFVFASWTGPGKWTVAACEGEGTLT
jgi:hypothetical protein